MERLNITTSSGTPAWADLRAPGEVPERLRRVVIIKSTRGAALGAKLEGLDSESDAAALLAEDDMRYIRELDDAVALCFLADWSFDLPVTADGLGDLPGPVYDQIVNATRPLVPALMPSFGVDGAMDPKAATGSS